MIVIRGVNKRFGKLQALNNINVECRRGECIALIGPNGSGKTTLIKCILGMVVNDSGTISFDGRNISKEWKYRGNIGYMPQIGRYPDNMTIGQIFAMMKDIRHNEKSARDEDLYNDFKLHGLLGKRMRTLSGGTRQKVSAALAFMFDPAVLILDEPTAGLDPVSSEILKAKIIKEKNKGKLILLTSHVLSDLDDLITEVIYMQDGRISFHKPVSDLRQDTGEDKLSRVIASVMLNQQL